MKKIYFILSFLQCFDLFAQGEIEFGMTLSEVAELIEQDHLNPKSLVYDSDDKNISIISDTFSIFNFGAEEINGIRYFIFDSTLVCFCILIVSDCFSLDYDLPFYQNNLKKMKECLWVGRSGRKKFFIESNQFENDQCAFYFWTDEVAIPESWWFVKHEKQNAK